MNSLFNKASSYRGTNPYLGKIFIGLSGTMALFSAYNYFSGHQAQNEIDFRKSQLQLPIYKLSDE